MVGLGLVERPVPSAGATAPGALHLTGNGERLCTLVNKIHRPLPQGSSAGAVEGVAALLRRAGIYDEASEMLAGSPTMRNFQTYLATEGAKEVQRSDQFYLRYGVRFGIAGNDAWTARNRVPSALQLAQLCGLVSPSGAGFANRTAIKYGDGKPRPRGRVYRAVAAKAKVHTQELEDELERFLDDSAASAPGSKTRLVTTLARDLGLSTALKSLYKGRCQICRSTFAKKDGNPYSESHHLIPLGQRGADKPANVVILCATCHRKMHYADIRRLPSAGGREFVVINGLTSEIRYSSAHRRFLSSARESSDR